jgi:hypothetical protein
MRRKRVYLSQNIAPILDSHYPQLISMRNFLFRLPFQKYISASLVALLLISQTIRVDFFDDVSADPAKYRDIISIIVDRDTFSSVGSAVRNYASDVQSYLGGTRVSLLVIDPGTPPAVIAARNERLYAE